MFWIVTSRIPADLAGQGIQRTKQKSWPLFRGIEPKVDALEVIFEFINVIRNNKYKEVVWQTPDRATLKAAVEALLAPKPWLVNIP